MSTSNHDTNNPDQITKRPTTAPSSTLWIDPSVLNSVRDNLLIDHNTVHDSKKPSQAVNVGSEDCATDWETERQRQMLDQAALRYAEGLNWSIETDAPDSNIDAYGRLLGNELESYKWCLPWNSGWSPGTQPSSLQITIRWSAKYAQSYLEYGYSVGEVEKMIIQDMNEEQRMLPRWVAVWIVQEVLKER